MQASAETDAALIEASRRGESAAFAGIIERHQRAVYAVSFSTVRDRALADDITQETFVIAWRRFHELRDCSRLPAWLCGIARNLGRDVRKRRRRETIDDSIETVDGKTPYEAMSEAESERIVAAALGQVPDVYREPLVLFYYEERSVDDVARCLGISAATTNKRLSRGRRCLAERVATVVERQLERRGPSPTLAASVLAVVGFTASASHVDASPVTKGSTMHKLAIAAVVTASVGGAGLLAVTTTRTDAHAGTTSSSADPHRAHTSTQTHAAAQGDADCAAAAMMAHLKPSLGALGELSESGGGGASAASSSANDCDAVGRHLAELEADATHGAANRPDEATCEQCASHYSTQCELQGWSVERRTCSLAAGDLMNAHLCAGAASAATAPQPADIPLTLRCETLASHIGTIVQAAGIYPDVTDMPQQLQSACEMGSWPIELRRCFAAADSVTLLQACIAPQ